jgi:signal transduction histidine kinase
LVKQAARTPHHPRALPDRSARRHGAAGSDGGLAPDLLALLAHELRTPLAAFEVTLDLLRQPTELDPDDMRCLIQRLHQGSRWMAGVVNNLLALTMLERASPPLTLVPMPALAVIEPALTLVQPLLDRRQQRQRLLCPDPDVWIRADAQFLGQALVNLLMNASGYSPPESVISVDARVARQRVEIRVSDHGPGIPPAERDHIFDCYARGSSARLAPRGLGLGLYLVRLIAEHHDGVVRVDSVVGRGASFWISLPRVAPPATIEG